MVIVFTALDTTWQMFVPILGGLFVGIGLDKVFNVVPIATILCLIVGTGITILLVTQQLRTVRGGQKSQKRKETN